MQTIHRTFVRTPKPKTVMKAVFLILLHATIGIEIAYCFQGIGARQPRHHVLWMELSSRLLMLTGQRRSSPRTALTAKLWDRLAIEEDLEPNWYLLNCVAGLEMDLLKQCRDACADLPDAIKFVVPTEKKTRSHGANRMVTEPKVKYQGYVFAKLRLCSDVYERIQALDLCRSWMGTVNQKGARYDMKTQCSLSDNAVTFNPATLTCYSWLWLRQ